MRFILLCISFIIKVILFFIAIGLGMVLGYFVVSIFIEVFYPDASGKDRYIVMIHWLPFMGLIFGIILFIYFLRLFNAVSKSWFKDSFNKYGYDIDGYNRQGYNKYGFNRDGNKKE